MGTVHSRYGHLRQKSQDLDAENNLCVHSVGAVAVWPSWVYVVQRLLAQLSQNCMRRILTMTKNCLPSPIMCRMHLTMQDSIMLEHGVLDFAAPCSNLLRSRKKRKR